MSSPTQILLSDIEAFLSNSRMKPSTFGHEAVGDPNFVRNLRKGREPRFNTVQRVKGFIETHAAHSEESESAA